MNSVFCAKSVSRALATAALSLGLGAPALADSYTITDLGAMLGNVPSYAYGINNRGDVALQAGNSGYVYNAGTSTMASINTAVATVPLAISNTGYVAGVRDTGMGLDFGSPFLYANGVYTPLSVGAMGQSYGRGVNDAGQVAGSGYFADPLTSGKWRGFIYDDGVVVQLGTLGGRSSYAWGINNKGQAAGISDDKNYQNHIALFDNGAVIDLGLCRGCGVFEINDSSEVVGYRDFSTGPAAWDVATHGFLYTNGELRDLGTLGGERSQAFGINEQGQVVGYSNVAGQSSNVWRAFIYSNDSMIDLNNLIDPDSGWVLTHARDINDRGQIIGWGMVGGQQRAYLLTPTAVPVPAGVWLFGSALAGLLGIARRRG